MKLFKLSRVSCEISCILAGYDTNEYVYEPYWKGIFHKYGFID
jgi:hypothetical protein